MEEKLNEMKRKSLMEQKYVKDESSALRQMEEKVGRPRYFMCRDKIIPKKPYPNPESITGAEGL